MRIKLEPMPRPANRIVFFGAEIIFILRRWLRAREGRNKMGIRALLLNTKGYRLDLRRHSAVGG